ncbi:hypothetical protein A11S_995 [Micavibrio aeruginosavorus EPB]|uniref:Uncharacterized protein n=1 Tax=Micavibrio aeruginosavorus EPB TaxID=349215 RepID=M4VH48_9BACT|nr:hypothetical protein A11S_995 [Micavibrio aeruginosavorus EPB]
MIVSNKMSRMFIVSFVFFVFLVWAENSYAYVIGGSNLGFSGYPEADCVVPYKPYEFLDEYEVERYNRNLEEYVTCIKEYLENADNDIRRIQEAAEAAIREAKSL